MSYLKVRRAIPGFLGRRDLFLDVLVRSVLYPKLLNKLLESGVSVITLFKSIGLIGSIASVFSLLSSIEII
jgi:hypothetical protein